MTTTNEWAESVANSSATEEAAAEQVVVLDEDVQEEAPENVTVEVGEDGEINVVDEPQEEEEEPEEKVEGQYALVQYDASKHSVQTGGSSALAFIRSLPQQTYTELLQTFTGAVNAERTMFVIRGAAAHELYKRACSEENRKFSKQLGEGIDTFMKDISKEVGVEAMTLYRDFLVFDEFGETLIEYLAESVERILPREFYVLAINTSKNIVTTPTEVLEYFETKREQTDSYFVDHARRDIKKINTGLSLKEVSDEDNDERAAALAGNKDKKAPAPKDKNLSVNIAANWQNEFYLRKVIETYGSFSTWFAKRAKEEFGDAVKPVAPPKAAPPKKTKTKTKTGGKKTTAGKTTTTPKKTTAPKAKK